MKLKKPNVAEILELYQDCQKRYSTSGVYQLFDNDEKDYELDFLGELNLPREFANEGIVLPTARDLVDACVDNTDLFNPRVWVSRKGESEKSKKEQNMLRKFGLGVLYRNNVEASISPLRVAGKHYWMHGLGILKTVWDADRWVDRPERNEGEDETAYAARIDEWRSETHDSIPIVIQGINPKNIMLDPYYDGGMFVFETREELVFNVKAKYPKWATEKKVTDKVEHVSFWTKNFRCELYDKQPVLRSGVVEHTYGFIPFVPIDTGLGNVSSDNDLKKRYVGVLRYVKSILRSESRDYSIADIILKKQAFPWGYLKGANAASVTEVFQKFGEYNALPDGVEIVDMAPKVPPDALLSWLSVASSYLSSHAAPPSVRGLGEQGVRAASDRRQMIAQASIRYLYSNEAFKHGVAKVLSNCARIMKNVIPGNINVWAKTPTDEFDIEIKKEEMKEPFTFYVEFSPISEEDEYRRHDDLERLVQSTLVTKDWARRQMSNVDAEAMGLDEEVERLKLDPAVQQIISQYMTAKMMEAIQKRSMAESVGNPPPPITPEMMGGQPMGGQPTGQPAPETGRRGVPNVQPIITPGSAPAIQNALAAQRSQVPMSATQGRGVGAGGNR